ncbi:MAG: VF530 family protein [Gammaproteobacteria bacterium]|nr:VF530 family protein [Gammaproteobacteria bacterium]MBU0787745.1 VF530 family protein [Gammaproteobacteria bacterium]MBU0814785.1 VF530 family protein [Gammaproteobacteria bacterium]MBU1786107.1 VF530 family protein [Gammaproteobacteria bacterium]
MTEADPSSARPPPDKPAQPRNPLHGLTLEAIMTALVAHYDWPGLAERIPVRCFISDPSIKSSLNFLRKTPWAREKVEGLYLFMLREERRAGGGGSPAPGRRHSPNR